MKKIIFYLLLALNMIQPAFSQQTFEKLLSIPKDETIQDIIEEENGNYLLIGRSINNETNTTSGYILRIDGSGNVLSEISGLSSDTSSAFSNLHYINCYYYLIGTRKANIETNESRLWILQLNPNLEILHTSMFKIPKNRRFSYINSIVDSDSNFVITGYVTRDDTTNGGVVFRNNDAFFYKISLGGDSLTSRFYTSDIPWHFSFDIIESTDKTKYYAFVCHFADDIYEYDSQRFTLSKNFDSIALEPIPFWMHDPNSPVYLNQTDILISGKGQGEYTYNHIIAIHNEAGEIINTNHFKKEPYREQPPMKNGISKFGDNIYVGGNSNFDYGNPFWSSQDSWFHLVKVNSDLSMVWEKWFGGDAYYFMYNLLATRDGGCIMVGNRYDDQTQNQERDVYIVKVNEDGLIVWEQEISINDRFSTIYPNPGSQLHIRLAMQHPKAQLQLFDQAGRLILRQQLHQTESTVETSHLPSGVYLYQLRAPTGLNESGKWVKE